MKNISKYQCKCKHDYRSHYHPQNELNTECGVGWCECSKFISSKDSLKSIVEAAKGSPLKDNAKKVL